jgi:hypothetical protein
VGVASRDEVKCLWGNKDDEMNRKDWSWKDGRFVSLLAT